MFQSLLIWDQEKRIRIWNQYYSGLKLLEEKGYFKLPLIPDYATNNGHLFYLLADSLETRNNLIQFLAKSNINAVFHYLPLHQSPFIQKAGSSNELTNVLKFSNQLIRLPLFFEITDLQVDYIIQKITDFYKK